MKKAVIVMMHLQTKEKQGLLAVTRSQDGRHGTGFPSQPSEEPILLTSSLQKHEIVNFCCFKPHNLCCFVTTALGTSYNSK